ncbi:MAG: hypothetical protein WC526_03360 [Patescibacteria group bacterium]
MRYVNDEGKEHVYPATPFDPKETSKGSFGDASHMLLRQFNFPEKFTPEKDRLTLCDHDRIMERHSQAATAIFRKYTGRGELALTDWLKSANDDKVMALLLELMQLDLPELGAIHWTGYRICYSVNRGNGYPVYTLELFVKRSEDTKVSTANPQNPKRK